MIKKIHKLILRAWIGPFLVSFSVILFILVLQFLAKYMDDLFGKGFEAIVLFKVFCYACLTLVTMALPLGVLLSSLLTMGNLGERYELASLKSSGVGLFRIMAPLTNVTVFVTMCALVFSFYLMPIANLKLYTLLYDLSKVKPTFALKENHFYNGVDGLVIHANDINRETDVLTGIKIYDHTDNVGNKRITVADRGTMLPSDSTGYLKMTLYDGVIHEHVGKDPGEKKKFLYQRFYFDTLRYEVPLSGFDLEESDENTFRNHQYMLDIFELAAAVDSIGSRNQKNYAELEQYMLKYVHVDTTVHDGMKKMIAKDSTKYGKDGKIQTDTARAVYAWFPDLNKVELMNKAIHQARAIKNYARVVDDRIYRETAKHRKFRIEHHNRWMLPMSCLVFLFLGAPLGAIIRKGGIGLPVIFSIVFFIIFYILMIQGRKFARDDLLPVWVGVWLPVLVMFPMAIIFTYQSATDSRILYSEAWWKVWRRVRRFIPFVKKGSGDGGRSTLSIEDLIAKRERQKRDAIAAMERYEEEKREKEGKGKSSAKDKQKNERKNTDSKNEHTIDGETDKDDST
ncbi:MAG: LptF/LptG family permease [Bacteroidota bacterium]